MNIFDAIQAGDAAAFDKILAQDSDQIYHTNRVGIHPVMLALYYGRKVFAQKLQRHMPVLNIWEAAALGDFQTLKAGLAADSALLNAFSADGYPPLGLAAFFGRVEVVTWLLEQGADPDQRASNSMGVCPIHAALAGNDPHHALAILRLLLAHDVDVNMPQPGGWTALHQAADNGSREQVELLLEYGAERRAKIDDGRMPADIAAEKGHNHLTALLR